MAKRYQRPYVDGYRSASRSPEAAERSTGRSHFTSKAPIPGSVYEAVAAGRLRFGADVEKVDVDGDAIAGGCSDWMSPSDAGIHHPPSAGANGPWRTGGATTSRRRIVEVEVEVEVLRSESQPELKLFVA